MEDHHYDQPVCPYCGSQNVETDNSDVVIGLATFFILDFPQGLAPLTNETIPQLCLECGHRWEQQNNQNLG